MIEVITVGYGGQYRPVSDQNLNETF